jgi:acyl-CoA synthetase (NDP forming)
MINEQKISRILCGARERGETVLLETEGYKILRAMGFKTPAQIFVRNSSKVRAEDLASLGSERAVVKIVSPNILHKSDVGGIEIVANNCNAVAEFLTIMRSATKCFWV